MRDLAGMIVALDLIVSDVGGIDGKDMPGAKIVASAARTPVEEVRKTWKEAADAARQARGVVESGTEPQGNAVGGRP